MSDPAELLRSEIGGLLPSWLGSGAAMVPESFRLMERRWSFEVRFSADVAGAPVPCIGKIPRWEGASSLMAVLDAGPQPNVGIEYRTLVEIREMVDAARDPEFGAIEPVGYAPQLNLIVTRVLDAEPLAGRRHGRIDALRRAGRWLRAFHDTVGGAADAEAPVEALQRRLLGAVPEEVPPGWDEPVARVSEGLAALAGRPLRCGDLHGDVNTANVLVDGSGRVALIDPNRRRGVVLEDVAHLVAELRVSKLRVALGTAAGRRRDRLAQAVVGGYRPVRPEVLGPLIGLDLVERWGEIEARLAADPRRVVMPAVRRHLRAEIERAVSPPV